VILVGAAALMATVVSSCATPAAAGRIRAAHPGATFQASVRGCDVHPRAGGRHFGRDARAAVLWARQMVGAARLTACEVAVDAVDGDARYRAYEIARDAAGELTERVLVP
jgi:hypothetical protein